MNRAAAPPRLAMALLAAGLLAGCAPLADRLTPVDAHIWRPGITRERQIVEALGPPADESFLPDGNLLVRWRGLVGVRGRERLAYGFVFTPDRYLVRNANRGELHAPGL